MREPVPHLRHNLLALGADYALFLVGLSFASQSTILPAFAAHLGARNVVIGAIPAVMTLGWSLPSLFAAGHTERLPRKLPFVVRWTVWERVPFLALALVAFFLAGAAPGLALAALVLLLLVTTGVGGVLMPAWLDIVGRAIPVTLRGRFFAVASTVAGVAGFGGALLSARVLATVPAPASYGVCFLLTSASMGLSYVALTRTREPATVPPDPAPRPRANLARVPALLRRDPNLAWFLVARAFGLVGTMSTGFYTVYALRAWALPAAVVGWFIALLVAGTVVANLVLGWLADHAGHRVVLLVGVAASLVANVVALTAPSPAAFATVFVLVGVQAAVMSVSNFSVLLEFAPRVDEQPTYVGLGTTSMAPVAFLAPLLAGYLADARGFSAVFATAVAGAAAAAALLALRVRDPRAVIAG